MRLKAYTENQLAHRQFSLMARARVYKLQDQDKEINRPTEMGE